MVKTVYSLIALALAVNSAYGLTCYSCDSSKDSTCAYGLLSFIHSTEECNTGSITDFIPKQCVKVVATNNEGSEFVARSCSPYVGNTLCQGLVKTIGIFSKLEGNIKDINCYACDGDKCNSAPKITSFSIVALILATMAYLF